MATDATALLKNVNTDFSTFTPEQKAGAVASGTALKLNTPQSPESSVTTLPPTTTSKAVTSEVLTPVPKMNVTTPPPSATASEVINTAGNVAQNEMDISKQQSAYEASQKEVGSLAEQLGGKTAEGLSLAESTGLNKVNQDIAKNNAEILALQNATNQEKQRLTQVPGMTQAGLQGIYQDIDTRNAFKITNLQMANAFASINAQGLQKTIETQLELKYSPIMAKLEVAKMNYETNKDFFTKAEQRKFDENLRKKENEIEKQRANDEKKYDLLKTALNNGVQIPTNLLTQINNPNTDYKKAASILAGAGISLENAQEKELKRLQIAKARQDLNTPGGGKPPTQAQYTVAGYAGRVAQSNGLINNLQNNITRLGALRFAAESKLPSFMQSGEVQQQMQAERNFVNAILRRESGAAIAPSEFDSATKQYFPRPGDSAETLAQKAANREMVQRNLIAASGSAYEEVVPMSNVTAPAGTTITAPDGQEIIIID